MMVTMMHDDSNGVMMKTANLALGVWKGTLQHWTDVLKV